MSTLMSTSVTFDGLYIGFSSCEEGAVRSTAGRRSYHHGDLRAALIDAATNLIRESGPAEFSLREAARIVGVDPAACYRHFRDREEVLVAIAQDGFADLADTLARTRKGVRGARAQLLAMSQGYLSFALERPAQFRLMFGESGVPSRDPRLRLPRVQRTAYEQLVDVATSYLGDARVDIEALANTLWAVSHGVARLIIDGAIPMAEPGARALLERATRAVLAGLR
jgi:AcrR family transcriptional regulator